MWLRRRVFFLGSCCSLDVDVRVAECYHKIFSIILHQKTCSEVDVIRRRPDFPTVRVVDETPTGRLVLKVGVIGSLSG